jgi:hypothetical protein
LPAHNTFRITGSRLVVDRHFHASRPDLTDSPQHPRRTFINAPKSLIPGVTIKELSIDVAISHVEGYDTHRVNVADAVELILFARAFGIPTLESMACDHIEKQLERSFKFDGLADAVRELYEGFREAPCYGIGNEVVEVVTGVAAKVCSRRLADLHSDPAFKLLRKDFPRLTDDMLDAIAVAEESERYGKQVKAEGRDSVRPQDSPQEGLE